MTNQQVKAMTIDELTQEIFEVIGVAPVIHHMSDDAGNHWLELRTSDHPREDLIALEFELSVRTELQSYGELLHPRDWKLQIWPDKRYEDWL